MKWTQPICLLLAALLAVYFQSAFDGFRRLFGAQIDILPALAIYAGLRKGLFEIVLVSVGGGLTFDSISANPPGLSVIPLLAIGWFVHEKRGVILKDQAFAQFLLGGAACGLAPLLAFALHMATQNPADPSPLVNWSSLWQWSIMALFGGLLTPPIFFILDKSNLSLNYQPLIADQYSNRRVIKRGKT